MTCHAATPDLTQSPYPVGLSLFHSLPHLSEGGVGNGGRLAPNYPISPTPHLIYTQLPDSASAVDSGLPPSIGYHDNAIGWQAEGADGDALRVDIEVYSYQPMRAHVQDYRSGRGGGGAGARVRRLRMSVRALHPIYQRRGWRRWQREADRRSRRQEKPFAHTWPNTNRSVAWTKHFLNQVTIEMEDFKISDDQVRVATETFKRFDKRGQDKISTTDLGPAFSALKASIKPDLLKVWADEVDDDATGFIDLKGFLSVYGKILQNEQDEEDLRQAFRVLDKNRRGEIDVDDLRWILKGLGDDLTEEEIDEMIRDTDRDGSGFVDFDEFKKLMTSE